MDWLEEVTTPSQLVQRGVFTHFLHLTARTEIGRDAYIKSVASAVDQLGPNKVNLKEPNVVVTVQVLRTMCGISASYNFTSLKR